MTIHIKADNKSSAIKELICITPGDGNADNLDKTEIKTIREMIPGNTPGYPCRFALINNSDEAFTIELDYTPAITYDEDTDPGQKLIVHYYPNYRILGDNNDFSEFSDYDESNPGKGHWKLPSDWHTLIIQGALADMYPEMKGRYEAECTRKKNGQYINSELKLKSHLGVTNYRHGRR